MNYTEITPELRLDCEKESKLDLAPATSRCKESTSYFCRNILGIKSYTWQHLLWKTLDARNTRVACITSRQIGKSTALAIFALKQAVYNLRPAGISNKTHIGIISATDEQSKKVMLEIRRLIQAGDDYVKEDTKGKIPNFLSNQIDSSVEAANNKTTITFENGNTIVCLPPTDRVRGYSFSYVFVDEAAFIEDEGIFFQCIEPTVSHTNGVIVLTTTPNGQQGFLYELFDPEDKNKEHEYIRFWIHYSSIDDKKHIEQIEKKKEFYYDTGREKEFKQEYDALFTSQVSAFFDSSDVDNMIDLNLTRESFWKKDVTHLGIDFGMVNSNTVISIVRKEKDTIKLVWQYIYPPGTDTNLMNDVKTLMQDYSVEKVIVDDCPQGDYIIKEMTKEGFPLTTMKFRTEKVAKYVSFRSMLHKGKIKSYDTDELKKQMKAMQEIQGVVTVKIEKPTGGKDDAVDSFLLACYHYLDQDTSFESYAVLPADKTLEPELMEELELWGNKICEQKM